MGPIVRSAFEAELEKIAAIWGCALSSSMPCGPDISKKRSDRFRDTPFHKVALSLEKSEADKQIGFAQEAVVSAERQMREAQFRVRVATLEAKLLNWKAQESGESARDEMKEKLACCSPCSYSGMGNWEWSDHFKISPFYKEAVALDAEDAHMNVERAKRSIEDSKRWRGDDEDRVAWAELEAAYADYRVKALS